VVIFSLYVVFQLISFPLNMLLPDALFAFFEEITGAYFVNIAYVASVVTFFLLLLGYYALPCRYWARKFQKKNITDCPDAKVVRLWFVSATAIIALCLVAYVRMGFRIPLLMAVSMSGLDALSLRFESSNAIGTEIVVLCQYLFLPFNTLIVFGIATKRHPLLMLGTVGLYLLVGLFTLERSTLVIPVLVYFAARMSLKPMQWTSLLRPFLIALGLSGSMVAFSHFGSTKDLGSLMSLFVGRLVHGQWLGLPAYLWHYNNMSIELSSVVHPYLKALFQLKDTVTPGTELMMTIYPAAVASDTVGNIPTLFIGEAYAIGGWLMVGFAIVHVILFIGTCAWMFTKIRKTPATCVLYGIVVVKISMGLVLGYSMFMFSALTVLVCVILFYVLLLTVCNQNTHFAKVQN